MYSSRGIGRQTSGDRRTNDRDRLTSNRSPYQNSPDINFRSDARDYDNKTSKAHNDRREYRNSPDIDSSYGVSSRDGYTPPEPPPQSIPMKKEVPPIPKSYVPMPSNAKPSQPNYSSNVGSNQSYESNRTPKYSATPAPNYTPTPSYTPTPNYTPTPISGYRPNPASSLNQIQSAGPYGRDPYSDDGPPTQKEIEERLWEQKIEILFQGINSIDDLITLKEQYSQKTQNLVAILEKSNLREGEILRNKRRNRDDFKDPAMLELRTMQADIKRKLEEVNKFRVEIDKRIRHYNKAMKESMDKAMEEVPNELAVEKPHNYEAQLLQNSMITTTAAEDEEEDEEDEYEYENSTKEYYDPGSHWCRDCDKMVLKINEFFEHLHTKEHWGTANNELKPWKKAKKPPIVDPSYPKPIKTKTAIKGIQFLIPLRGFYCPLCKDYLADNFMAEEHMKGAKHNRIYNRFICLNMDYEHKWNTDKGKALNKLQSNERKRIKDEEQKELEKKKKLEEQKLKEEKEAKKRKREEEMKKKQKEEREREREEYKKTKSSHVSTSSERFRLKDVTLDLKSDKWSHKDKDRGREREKQKKKTRIYSSSDSSSSPPPKKKPINFEVLMKDPKLKWKSFVKLIPLNKKTAQKYKCKELLKVIEESKSMREISIGDKKIESKTEITIANSPITIQIDMNDEQDNKDIKNLVEGVIENLNEEDFNEDHNPTKSDEKDEQKSVEDKDSENERKCEETEKDNIISSVTKNSDNCENTIKSDKQEEDVPEESESEPNLEIVTEPQTQDNNENKLVPKESDFNDKGNEENMDCNDSNEHN